MSSYKKIVVYIFLLSLSCSTTATITTRDWKEVEAKIAYRDTKTLLVISSGLSYTIGLSMFIWGLTYYISSSNATDVSTQNIKTQNTIIVPQIYAKDNSSFYGLSSICRF